MKRGLRQFTRIEYGCQNDYGLISNIRALREIRGYHHFAEMFQPIPSLSVPLRALRLCVRPLQQTDRRNFATVLPKEADFSAARAKPQHIII
jgi:hypothetical protein